MTARAVCGVLASVFLAVKLFTGEVNFRDDPTSMLILRRAPSLESRFHALPDGTTVLAADENGYVGQNAWRFVTGIGWILLPAALIGIQAGSRVRRGAR